MSTVKFLAFASLVFAACDGGSGMRIDPPAKLAVDSGAQDAEQVDAQGPQIDAYAPRLDSMTADAKAEPNARLAQDSGAAETPTVDARQEADAASPIDMRPVADLGADLLPAVDIRPACLPCSAMPKPVVSSANLHTDLSAKAGSQHTVTFSFSSWCGFFASARQVSGPSVAFIGDVSTIPMSVYDNRGDVQVYTSKPVTVVFTFDRCRQEACPEQSCAIESEPFTYYQATPGFGACDGAKATIGGCPNP